MNEVTEETQLALPRPQIDSQLRVQAALNTPERAASEESHDESLRNALFSPFAMQSSQDSSSVSKLPLSLAQVERQAMTKNMLKDYSTMVIISATGINAII